MSATRRSAGSAALGLAVAGLLGAALAPVSADDPVGTNVTFNREIVRIIQRKCESCHMADGLSIPLSDYRDVRAWGRAIREELAEGRMPPAIVARGYGQYETDPSLNARELATFLAWLDGGMPRGDEADRPAPVVESPHNHSEGPASIELALPAQTVPAGEDLVIRRVTVDAGAAAGRFVSRAQLRPGDRRVLRGARMFAGSQWIGSWLPWQHAIAPPRSHAFQLPQRTELIVELYYRGADSPRVDQSVLEVSFGPDPAPARLGDIVVEASDRATARARGSVRLTQPAAVWALYPALDASVQSMELRVERPDQSSEVLMWIPRARAQWPLALVMRDPVVLPTGSTVRLVAETDSSQRVSSAPRVTLSVMQ